MVRTWGLFLRSGGAESDNDSFFVRVIVFTALGDGVTYCSSFAECVAASDVLVVMNMDPAFETLPALVRSGQTVIDPWRAFRAKLPESITYILMGIGL